MKEKKYCVWSWRDDFPNPSFVFLDLETAIGLYDHMRALNYNVVIADVEENATIKDSREGVIESVYDTKTLRPMIKDTLYTACEDKKSGEMKVFASVNNGTTWERVKGKFAKVILEQLKENHEKPFIP